MSIEQCRDSIVEKDFIRPEFGNGMMFFPAFILQAAKALFAARDDAHSCDLRAHLARGEIGYQQVVFEKCSSYGCDVGIVSLSPDQLVIDILVEEAAISSLYGLVDVAQIIDGHRLDRGGDDIACCQHAGEQGGGEHQREDDQEHLCAATKDVAQANLEKDGIADCQQRYAAGDDCGNDHKDGRQSIEWNTEELCHGCFGNSSEACKAL